MEKEMNEPPSEDRDEAPPALVIESERFDLDALRLSTLASPAFTNDDGGSEDFSAMSTGLSLATDDNEASERGSESENDGGLSMPDKATSTDQEDQDGAAEDENKDDGRSDRLDQTSNERDLSTAETNSERGELNVTAHDDASRDTMSTDEQSVALLFPPRMDLGQADKKTETSRHDRVARSLRANSECEDDMTVECASPRDPADLDDDVQGQPLFPVPTDAKAKYVGVHTETAPLAALPPRESASESVPTMLYSVKALFPTVYENHHPNRTRNSPPLSSRHKESIDRARRSAPSPNSTKKPPPVPVMSQVKAKARSADLDAREQIQSLQQQVEMLKHQLDHSSKSLALQLHVVDTERKQVEQRNARLKTQLTALTADLMQTKADAAKWKTENALYAAKMPKLQAELSDETTQVDEKHAQTIQSQLEITQLRAKLQVLQTRTGNLDNQQEKLQIELRVAKKELRRRAIVQQQSDEKLKKLETEFHQARVSHAQELHAAKQKLAATVHRMDHERTKRENELKKRHQQQVEDAKAALGKAAKNRKEAELATATQLHELAAMKKRVDEQDEENRTFARDAKSMESRLARAERTDTSLRSQITGLKIQLQISERGKHKAARATGRPPQASVSLKGRSLSPRNAAFRPESPQVGRNQPTPEPQYCSCCQSMLGSMDKADRLDESTENEAQSEPVHSPSKPTSFLCPRCPPLEAELWAARGELEQVRLLHASELKAQAAALERVLAAFRSGPSVATLQCA